MQLLRPQADHSLPIETLLARIRSRRARLEADRDQADLLDPRSGAGWIYDRLDQTALARLEPFLEFLALRELLLALRYLMAAEPLPTESETFDLLNPLLLRHRQLSGQPIALLGLLERRLAGRYRFAAGLTTTWLNQGPGGVELQLESGLLQDNLTRAKHPAVRLFLRYQLDMHNLLAVLKHWRWQLKTGPPLLAGGESPPARLRRLWHSRDLLSASRLISRLGGASTLETDPRASEKLLLDGLSQRLRRAGRDPLGVGVIIDYCWRCRTARGNLLLRRNLYERNQELAMEAQLR